MTHQVTCRCGQVLKASADDAGSFLTCSCGATVPVPSLSELQENAATEPNFELPPETPPRLDAPAGESPKDRLANFQETLSKLTPRVFMTQLLVGLSVLVFVLMAVNGAGLIEPNIPKLLAWGANFGPQTLAGEWWRLLTCMSVHIGIIHLAFNMWVLLTVGPLVERMLGNVGFLVLYVSAGLMGSLASLFWHPMLVTAGASGAIFGIYGALLAILLRNRGSIPAETLVQLRNSGLGFLAYNLIFGLTQPNIDSAAHLGGLIGGFLFGLVQSQPFTSESLPGRGIRNLCVGVLCVALVFFGAVGVSARHPGIAEMLAKIQQENVEVFYSKGATKQDAERLAAFLTHTWAPKSKITVKVTKATEGYQFHMVVKQEFQNNEKLLKQLVFDGVRMSRKVFDGAPVEVIVCDDHLKPLRSVPPRADFRHGLVEGKTELFYSAEINLDEAQRLASHISKVFRGGQTLVKLAQRGDVKEVHLMFRQDMLNNPAVIAELRQIRNDISVEVFPGTAVELHLCDEAFNATQVLKP